jgi:hypothetical protein
MLPGNPVLAQQNLSVSALAKVREQLVLLLDIVEFLLKRVLLFFHNLFLNINVY